MRNYLGITGTPGTGKKTIAPTVAARLGIPCYGLNDLASFYGLAPRKGGQDEVNTVELGRRVVREVSGPSLLFGHLLPYALGRKDVIRVVVLRCEPAVLKDRLSARGYPWGKIIENVEAELIGVLSADSLVAFGRDKVAEFDTTKGSQRAAATAVARTLEGQEAKSTPIDWTLTYDSPEKLRSLLAAGGTTSAFA